MPDENTVLIPSAENISDDVENLFWRLKTQIQQLPPTGFSTEDKRVYLTSGVLAILSGILFWFSSDKAARRYVNYAKGTSAYSSVKRLEVLPKVGGFGTNTGFNAESYLTVHDAWLNPQSEIQKRLTGVKSEKLAD